MELDREAAAALGIPGDVVARAAARRREGRTLGEALAELGATDAATFARALAEAAGLPFAPAPPALPARELTAVLPMPFARRHLVLPLARDAAGLAVALADPAALAALDDLRLLYRAPLRPLVVPAPALRDAITRAYDAIARSAADTMDAIEGERLDLVASELDEPPDLLEAGDDTPVIRLVNALLAQAVKDGASDIHIEPWERGLAVRFRLDGLLHDVLAPPGRLAATIASRVKIMAGLDIAERRLPQDGRIRVRVAGRDIDVRVSIVPTAFGERVALRLLDRASALLELTDLGLAPATARPLERLLGQSHGIILVTGPTGSGKTTTLYAALRRIATGERNIMTIEDPIEYQLRGIGQIQASSRIGLTFAAGLRAVLRQDPDVILVVEIRDRETAEIGMQAALTGHLVFSTPHTNDAPGAMTCVVGAESARAAWQELRARGVYPTELREQAAGTGWAGRRLGAEELAAATRQLATLAGAGVPVAEALAAVAEQSEHPALVRGLTVAEARLREGEPLADALAASPRVFPPLFRDLVRAGEASGAL